MEGDIYDIGGERGWLGGGGEGVVFPILISVGILGGFYTYLPFCG